MKTHTGVLRWVNFRIILVVSVIEALLVILDTIDVISCHSSFNECWPWFLVMMANLPASIGIFQFVGFVYDFFHIESYLAQTMLMAFAFFFFGTLWWSALLHIPAFIARLRQKRQARMKRYPP